MPRSTPVRFFRPRDLIDSAPAAANVGRREDRRYSAQKTALLAFLGNNPGASIGDIARAVNRGTGTVANMLDDLTYEGSVIVDNQFRFRIKVKE